MGKRQRDPINHLDHLEVAVFLLPLWSGLEATNFCLAAEAAGLGVNQSINLGGVTGKRQQVSDFLAGYPDIEVMRWEVVDV